MSFIRQIFQWEKGKPLILLFASRRGGSTILAQALSASNDLSYIDQPFDLWKPDSPKGKVIASRIPYKFQSQFFNLNHEEYFQIKRYLKDIRKGKLDILAHKNRSKQRILKIVNAHGLINIMPEMEDALTVVLIRHPMAQAASVIRNGWGTCEQSFLEDQKWCKKYLSEVQIEKSKQIANRGSYFEKAVLNWCLEWFIPLNHLEIECHWIYYEHLVSHPEEILEEVYDYLHLPKTIDAIKRLQVPSNSSNFSTEETNSNIKEGKTEALLQGWRKQVTIEEIKKGQRILDLFGVSCYSMESNVPLV